MNGSNIIFVFTVLYQIHMGVSQGSTSTVAGGGSLHRIYFAIVPLPVQQGQFSKRSSEGLKKTLLFRDMSVNHLTPFPPPGFSNISVKVGFLF